MVDKNLFLYGLAIVTVMKDNAPRVKEWIDYHLLAGVDHFFIYDNDNGNNADYNEVIKPYVEAGILTDIKVSEWHMGLPHYNGSVKNWRFFCRYMAFIDQDEFIFPKSKSTITEIVDEILTPNPNAAALCPNWIMFGSNGQEKADYTRGLLERFTAREAEVNRHIKTVANPRRVNFFPNPHFAMYFDSNYSVNENGKPFVGPFNYDKTADKISVNHYYYKSREEWAKKVELENKAGFKRSMEDFDKTRHDQDIFDDGILKYRDARRAELGSTESIIATKKFDYQKIINALMKNLSPTIRENAPREVFAGKMENFLTCLNLSSYLKKNYFADDKSTLFEEISLNAVHKTLNTGLVSPDLMLLMGEMPKILRMKYPAVEKIRDFLIKILPQVMNFLRAQNRWQEFTDLNYKLELLKSFK